MRRSPLPWTVPLTAALVAAPLVVPRSSPAQTCNRACDPSQRDTQGCCPPPPPPGTGKPPGGSGPAVGKKCAVSAECPGDQVCIAYKCQKPPLASPPPAPTARPSSPPGQPLPPGRYAAIGVAWNNNGDWALRTAPTLADAQAAALAACSSMASGCFSTTSPVTPDRLQCIAIYRNGSTLRSQQDPNLQVAITRASQDCSALPAAPGCYQQVAVCNDRSLALPSPWAHVGLAWNNRGGWATRPATSVVEAQALALAACNKASGACFNAQYPIPGEQLECFAIAYDGKVLYEHHDPSQAVALAEVMKTCQGGANAAQCKVQGQACNNRR